MQSVIIQLKISKQYYNRLSKRRDLRMLESVVEFFKNLPDKVCVQCGEKIEEQSECYSSTCDKCNSL